MGEILNEELNQIFENAAVALILVNKDARIKRINKVGEEFFGQGIVDVNGKLPGEAFKCVHAFINENVVCGETKECANCPLRNSIETTYKTGNNLYKIAGDLEINLSDRVYNLNLLISTSLLEISDLKFVLVTIEDITNEKKLQNELKVREKELEELIASKNKFFSIIAHDLKNPFLTIEGFAKLLLDEYSQFNIEEREEFLGIIIQSSKNTYKLLENLLLWSQIQLGQMKCNIEEVSITEIINETLSQLSTMAEIKNIEINVISSMDIITKVDRFMFATVMRNLVTNAIKYTPKRGMISISSNIINNKLHVSVNDNGVGIKTEDFSKIFSITEKYTKQGTEQEEGSGLGLILCKEFIDLHKGEIWVESEIGEGSTFRYTIPIN